ncbi:hypothetical protein GCM10007158_01550 [Vreelandella hamiltonii]|uniref:Uncharacterized protein n=1 Tax=Halomonas johnsoniae TaxID=502832 RepID=A0ABQ2WDP3_9GAMM|nr:hypothetical protein GCM10007158_01550 [Halomonas johnsoniae]
MHRPKDTSKKQKAIHESNTARRQGCQKRHSVTETNAKTDSPRTKQRCPAQGPGSVGNSREKR